MKLFFGKSVSRVGKDSLESINDRAASRIVNWMLGVQEKFAVTMNKKFLKLSIVKRKIAVVFFCLIGGGLSIYYVLEAVAGARKENTTSIESVEPPRRYPPKETESSVDAYIDEDTWCKVQFFKRFMDSLKQSDGAAYEKIMVTRPGLMDSIHSLEQIYYSQKIK